MNFYSFLVLVLTSFLLVHTSLSLCPPSCYPPKNINDCKIYVKEAKCLEDVSNLSRTSAHCGCLWQKYIQSVNFRVSKAQECLTWAVTACSQLDNGIRKKILGGKTTKKLAAIDKKVMLSAETKQLANYVLKKVLQIVQHNRNSKSHEIAKSRKRNGVAFDKPEADKPKGLVIVEGVPVVDIVRVNPPVTQPPVVIPLQEEKLKETPILDGHAVIGRVVKVSEPQKTPADESQLSEGVNLLLPKKNTTSTSNLISEKPFREWMDFRIPADQFKLIVFMVILILNILVVLVLIFCRSNESYQSVKEAKPMGDLNPTAYNRDSQFDLPGEKSHTGLNIVYDKVKQSMHDHKEKKRREEHPFLLMEEINADNFTQSPSKYSKTSSPYVNTSLQRTPVRSSQKSSRGLYESVDEDDPFFLDNTYEEPPMPLAQTPPQEQNKPYRSGNNSERSSPIKQFLRKDEKSISFALPPGAFITLQDRVDGVVTEAEKEEGHGGISGTSQIVDES